MKLRLLKLVLTGLYLRGTTLTVVCSFILRDKTSSPCMDVLIFSFRHQSEANITTLAHIVEFLFPNFG